MAVLIFRRLCTSPFNYFSTRTIAINSTQTNKPQDNTREFYGSLRQVKTSPQKLNLVAKLIRGMDIANALIQVEFCEKKAADFVKSTLLDTQRRAVKTYGAKPLNLYVAESFVGKGEYLRRIRYHGRGRHGIMHKYYAHYFLKLKEGTPPKKKRKIEDQKIYKTRKLIERGPLSIPNSL